MPRVELTPDLRAEYARLFATCETTRHDTVRVTWARILSDRGVYEITGDLAGGVPWFVVGVLHTMESSGSFRKHLHNGDPLTDRTVHVPRGRPAKGTPPFSWSDSAVDALRLEALDIWRDWSLEGTLYRLELWNGFGYRRSHPEVLSPYLWGASNHYSAGKYVADGKFDSQAVSAQVGAAVLLKRGSAIGDVSFAATL